MGPPDTVPVLVPPAVPAKLTSPVAKPVTASLNMTVYRIGLVLVGSAWATAWLIVTVGAVTSQVTVLSVEVDAVLALPARSVARSARIVAMTVPEVVMPVVVTV